MWAGGEEEERNPLQPIQGHPRGKLVSYTWKGEAEEGMTTWQFIA